MKIKTNRKISTENTGKKDLEKTADYISEAEVRGKDTTLPPWETVDTKKTKIFSLRLPLDLHEKLKYVAENTPRTSMNNICIDGLEPYIDDLLEAILRKERGER